jgi:predicted DNA-binding transcriptional regulator AlpA
MTHHLVGMAEIAEMLGVSRQRVAQLIETYDDFPSPEVELTAGRIWSRTAIETWIATHPERGPGRPAVRFEKGGIEPQMFGQATSGLFERFTDRARLSVVKAQEEARLLSHNFIGTEHLLLGLIAIGEGVAFEVMKVLGVDLETTRTQVINLIGRGPQRPSGHVPFTPRAKKVLELSMREALALGHNYIGTEHILLALARTKDGVAIQALERMGHKSRAVRKTVLDMLQGLSIPTDPPEVATPLDLEDRIAAVEERLKKLEGPAASETDRPF